jgi:alkylation response protein AidB-like acyl-CoA dehydrogenase
MLEPSGEARAIVSRVREFVRDEIIPLEPKLMGGTIRDALPKLAQLRERGRAAGLWTPFLPRELGGLGMSLFDYAFVSEELGRSPIGHFALNCQAPDVGNMELLMAYGSDELKKRYLEPLTAGRIRSCFSMTEPEHAGSNPLWLSTRAIRDGNDYVIQGRKWFTTGADGAAFAIVMAVTNPEADTPYLRASQIVVPAETPGFRVVRNLSVMGESGGDWASHSEVAYDNVRVPVSNRLGDEGAGFVLAQERLGPGRIHHCMRWIGTCERAMDLMCQRAAKRELSPGKPLGTRQIIQEWIADSHAEIHASRLMVLSAAQAIDRDGAHAARDEISVIKFFVAGVLQRVLDRAIQTHGAIGLTDETPLAFWWRHERAARIYDGPDEVHKVSVARHILRRYGLDVR